MKTINTLKLKNNEKHIGIIKNMIKSGRLPGTIILEGSPGSAGSLADFLAAAVVCSDSGHKKETGEGCGVCAACKKAAKNIHPDIITAEPEDDGARSFHIDKVREIMEGLYLSPSESDKKVYIIKDMQSMTAQGQNALLKSLEEPPPSAVFIITAASLDLVLETVRSRAVRFRLEHETADNKNDYKEIITGILGKNRNKLAVYQDILKNLEKSGKNMILDFYCDLENAVRDIMIAKIFANDLTKARFLYFSENPEVPENYAGEYSVKKIFELCKKIQTYKFDLEYNANTRLNLSSFFCAVM
ncbi:MAG: hypothetical protein FWH24_01150 [Oscillospiraceae bacterium]|nr:hypothetical protein [Oscillospiraceae bacterium]